VLNIFGGRLQHFDASLQLCFYYMIFQRADIAGMIAGWFDYVIDEICLI
jgi:hypothetical protein